MKWADKRRNEIPVRGTKPAKLLKELKPGTRIVSHAFDMGSWKPEQALKVDGRSFYFWTIPAPGTPSYEAAMAAANGN